MKRAWFIGALLMLLGITVVFWWPGNSADEDGDDNRLSLMERVAAASSKTRAAKSLTESKSGFGELRAVLRQMDIKVAREWLLTEWRKGDDFSTQVDLSLDSGQNLAGWPSWRTFLLDMLFQIDPETAAGISTEVLASSESPDEWAVALRNLARSGGHDELIKSKSAELLRQKAWQKDPSAGYLEAFDVIVHTRNTALAPDLLVNCDTQEAKAVRHASFLTLDRLIAASPEVLLPELARTASQHPRSGLMLSNMMARADVRSEVQRRAVETYLLDPKRTAAELQGFASVFPNANVAVSSNLLTHAATIEGRELALRDRASLAAVTEWLADPRFSKVQDALRESLRRLQGFVAR